MAETEYGVQIDDMPFFGVTEDSFMMRNVDVRIVAKRLSLPPYHHKIQSRQ